MQNQLIPVKAGHIGNIETLTVNARDLHQFLGLRSQFGNWMQTRIKQYGFTAGVDFASLNKKIKRANGGGTTAVEYTLTLDMGKELAMVERNDKGREVRRYFIDCEKRLLAGRAAAPAALPEFTVPLTDYLTQAEEVGELRDQVADLEAEVLGLYRSKTPVRRVMVETVEKVPVAAIELMLRYNIPREEVAAVSGRTRDCLRVHIHYARKAGRLQ